MRPVESRYNIWIDRGDDAFVWNGVSGSLLRMSSGDRARVTNFLGGGAEAVDTDLLERMAIGRMLVRSNADELALLKQRYRSSREDHTSFGLTLVTSLGCNFDCPYCFEAKHPSIMDKATQASILEVVSDQLPRIDELCVTWFGGEPLVGRQPLFELSECFRSMCAQADVQYVASIVTNGYLLDEATAEALAAAGVVSAQVGLDGPPEVHDLMRPLRNGGSTFDRILRNLGCAANYLDLSVRVNVDSVNVLQAFELLELLAAAGLSRRISVNLGHIVPIAENPAAPSASYCRPCLPMQDFAEWDLAFDDLANRLGFSTRSLPSPSGAPCTAVRRNELVVGSRGELYKCWDSVGDPSEVIGHISAYRDLNSRVLKWLTYDPFEIDECTACVALPGCMGGCAHHGMDPKLRESRCGTFRFTHRQQIEQFIDAGGWGADRLPRNQLTSVIPAAAVAPPRSLPIIEIRSQ